MLTALPFLLLVDNSIFLYICYAILSGIYLSNLYFGIGYLTTNGHFIYSNEVVVTLSIIEVLTTLTLIGYFIFNHFKNEKN